SGKEKRSDGLLGERGNERRCAPQAPPVLYATALLLDSTRQEASMTADTPHHCTILLSSAALIVSIVAAGVSSLSWYESHASRRLATMATQAFLYVSDMMPTPINEPARKSAIKAGVLNVRFELKLFNRVHPDSQWVSRDPAMSEAGRMIR